MLSKIVEKGIAYIEQNPDKIQNINQMSTLIAQNANRIATTIAKNAQLIVSNKEKILGGIKNIEKNITKPSTILTIIANVAKKTGN